MAHLAASETQDDFDLVPFSQESQRMPDLGLKVMRVDPAGELDFLYLDDVLLFLCLFLVDNTPVLKIPKGLEA